MTRMKALAHLLCALTGFAVFLLPGVSAAQSDRDFVFDDEEGYRILRFARIGSGELTEDQLYEVSNAEFSSMVHDRIYADVLFDMEPVDSEWSGSQAPLITRYLDHRVPEFASRTVECRSTSCRIMLEHSGEWTITSHQGLMESVQLVIEEFVDANAEAFDSAFLITAYFQEFEAPHIKAFLRRADASH